MKLSNISTAELREELIKRNEARPPRTKLQTPNNIAEHMRPVLMAAEHEEMHVVYLNASNEVLGIRRVCVGSIDQCHVDPRLVFAPAVTLEATGIVLLHNHPSGDPEPSAQDVALTKQLREGGRQLCVRVLDHIVMGRTGQYVSMLARGMLRPELHAAERGTP